LKIEQIKTIVLTGLVLLSIVLFWKIVTFQQNYGFARDNQEYVNEVNIDKKKDIKELVYPMKVVYRVDDDVYKGTQNMEDITKIVNELHKWEFYSFQNSTDEFNYKFRDIADNQVMIFQYPGDIPFSLTKSIFNVTVESQEIPEQAVFNQIFIFRSDVINDDGVVYFATSDLRSVIKARVKHNYLEDFQKVMDEFENKGYDYIALSNNIGKYIYVQNEEMKLPIFQFHTQKLSYDLFKEALFPDPNFVKQEGNSFTDGTSLLKFNVVTDSFTYVNTSIPENTEENISDMISTSVQYINSHSGWTDSYYYSNAFQKPNKVVFQLYLKNYPVANDHSRMELEIGDNKVHSYKRPFVEYVSFASENITIESGEKIIEKLNTDNIKFDDLAIFYSYGPKKVMQPSWFYKQNNSWRKYSDETTRRE
jgi:regulatory protein YycH of two-component signal transduction system YycFG